MPFNYQQIIVKKTCISADKARDLFGSALLYGYDLLHLRYRLKLNNPTSEVTKLSAMASSLKKNKLTLPVRKTLQQADLGLAHVHHA